MKENTQNDLDSRINVRAIIIQFNTIGKDKGSMISKTTFRKLADFKVLKR